MEEQLGGPTGEFFLQSGLFLLTRTLRSIPLSSLTVAWQWGMCANVQVPCKHPTAAGRVWSQQASAFKGASCSNSQNGANRTSGSFRQIIVPTRDWAVDSLNLLLAGCPPFTTFLARSAFMIGGHVGGSHRRTSRLRPVATSEKRIGRYRHTTNHGPRPA